MDFEGFMRGYTQIFGTPTQTKLPTRSAMQVVALAICLAALLSLGVSRAAEAPDMSGADLYKEYCATCHGLHAHGDGPVAPTLKQKVPDLTLIARRRDGVFPAEEIHRVIDGRSMPRAHGSAEMPVWGWEFYGFEGEDAARRQRVAELIDQLVTYLRSIQQPGK